MSRLCILCGKRKPARRHRKYCKCCHEVHILGTGKFNLPEGHLFTEERNRRIDRMQRRAERGLPIFEEVEIDLA